MQGWQSLEEQEDEEENIDSIIELIRVEIEKLECSNLEIKVQNGGFYVEDPWY